MNDTDRLKTAVEYRVGEFDPEAFSVDEVNRRFTRLQRRRNKAAAAKDV